MNEEITRWLPLLVVTLAGIFALSQIRSNNITNARIKWLENLKQMLTDFIMESTVFQLKEGVSKGIEEIKQKDKISEDAKLFLNKINDSTFEHLKIIDCKYNLILLNLNPKEKLHQKLENLLEQYMNMFNQIPAQKNLNDYNILIRKMTPHSDTIILLVRYVMKLEWEKTKRSYFSRIFYLKFGKGKEILHEALNLKLLPIKEVHKT
ncbi:hypothetical protein J3S90_15655 [Flavobacterium sp. P4023]|uniref:LemA family protein n=1 Tax=Flavobacterium flabelliforme TaxID=2816119 RepID=A0ABS5CX72_9FLAO|nr:hypothetical protein [Flavobacterium flabelliforme]MBP4143236.1 hypothetical protein [Flavobacterium flabelliforme]